MLRQLFALTMVACNSGLYAKIANETAKQPNILFVISDDQSFPHASAYGCDWIKTPNFDKVAKQGILFTNAFVTSPGCSPSRASILTGRYPWQNEEAGTHGSSFPRKYKVFTEVLEEGGYAVGFTGKPWAPGDWKISGWKQNPVGQEFNRKLMMPTYTGISKNDYSANFNLFLDQRRAGQPFFFWFGANEPHRPYEEGSWQKDGKNGENTKIPGFLPVHPVVKGDLLDYAVEIEWYDRQLGKILDTLERRGELENTLVIITADNGMSFPRAKANCYEAGIHVPLAISWGKQIPPGQVADDLISTVDLAPTILEVAGLKFDGAFPMTGKSRMKQLRAPKFSNPQNTMEIFAGRERHSSARYENKGYPQRIIRTERYLYIRNYHPEYWPAGDPQVYLKDGSLGQMHHAYLDIDPGPTRQLYNRENIQNPLISSFFLAATAKRPAEELYDITKDGDCLINLAVDPQFKNIKMELSARLIHVLQVTGDARETGFNPEIWETYPRLKGEISKFPSEIKH